LPNGVKFEPLGNDTLYEMLITRFLSDTGSTSYYNILNQYSDNANGTPLDNSTLGGSYLDNTPYPASGNKTDPLFDRDIQAEVTRASSANSWVRGPNSVFFVFTGNGIQSCFAPPLISAACTFTSNGYCAYHYFFPQDSKPIIYANIPDVCPLPSPLNGPNNDPIGDVAVNLVSHELFEAVSDPQLDAWSSMGTNLEIGDICSWRFGYPDPDGSNILLHGNKYLVQQEWSNVDNSCVLTSGGSDYVTVGATPSYGSTALSTNSFNITYAFKGYSWWTLASDTNGSVTLRVDHGSQIETSVIQHGSTQQEKWCFDQSCSNSSFRPANGTSTTFYYYDLLAQQLSVSANIRNPPPFFIRFTLAPLVNGTTDSGETITYQLTETPTPIWMVRGTMVSVNSPIELGQGSRWFTSAPSWFVSGPSAIPNPIVYVLQYFLSVEGGSGGGNGQGWYDYGSGAVAGSAGTYARGLGTGQRVISFTVDGGTPTVVADALIDVPVIMGGPHLVQFASVPQYQVSLDPKATAALDSVTSPTIAADYYWYDSGTEVSVTLRYSWSVSGSQRQNLLSYTVDGATTIPARQSSGAIDILVNMDKNHNIEVSSALQFYVTADTGTIPGSQTGDSWFDLGTKLTIPGQYSHTYTANSGYKIYSAGPGFQILANTSVSMILWTGGSETLTFSALNARATVYVPGELDLIPLSVLDDGKPIAFSYSSPTGLLSLVGSSNFTITFGSAHPSPSWTFYLPILGLLIVGSVGSLLLVRRRKTRQVRRPPSSK